MKPEEKSDALDEKILAIPFRDFKAIRRLNIILWCAIVFSVTSFTAQFIILARLVSINHQVLTAEIPGLKKQIADRDKIISDQNHVIYEQAIPQITRICKELADRGGSCGEIILKPPEDTAGLPL